MTLNEAMKKLNQAINNHQKKIRIGENDKGYYSTTELEEVQGGVSFQIYELSSCWGFYHMIRMCGEKAFIQFDGKKLVVYTG